MGETAKQPFVRVLRRVDISKPKAWLIRLIAVLLSLVVCGLLIFIVTKTNPFDVFGGFFNGAFGTARRIWATVRDSMILLAISLALVPAFKMKFWNIGAEGQVLVGGLATAAILYYGGNNMPIGLMFVAMIVASIAAGLIWGIIPAWFKTKFGTNETLFTLMMNYVAIQLVKFFCIAWEAIEGSGTVGTINQKTNAGWLPTNFLSGIFGNFNSIISVLVVLALAVFIDIYMNKTQHGYEIAVVGESTNTARYAGINVKKVILRTMALSGAICGIAGFLIVSGSSHTISSDTAGGDGFTAIIVAWLGKLNPYVLIFISFCLVFLNKGAVQIASQFGLDQSASEVLTGIILFFVLGCEFFINYRLKFRSAKKEVA